MKIFIICSKSFYNRIDKIKTQLEYLNHEIILPNCYDAPNTELKYRKMGKSKHSKWKSEMIQHSQDVIISVDVVLVLNFDKNGTKNYIGGATFLEMYDAFKLNKQIYLFNPIPEGMLKDEINGFAPKVINGELSLIR